MANPANRGFLPEASISEYSIQEDNTLGALIKILDKVKKAFRTNYPTNIKIHSNNNIVTIFNTDSVYVIRHYIDENNNRTYENFRMPYIGSVLHIDYDKTNKEFIVYAIINEELMIYYIKNHQEEDNITFSFKNLVSNTKKTPEYITSSKNYIVLVTDDTRDIHIVRKSDIHRSKSKELISSTTMTTTSYIESLDQHIDKMKKHAKKSIFPCMAAKNLVRPSTYNIACYEKEDTIYLYIIENKLIRIEAYDKTTLSYLYTENLRKELIADNSADMIMLAHKYLQSIGVSLTNIFNAVISSDGQYNLISYNLYSGSSLRKYSIFYTDNDNNIHEVTSYELDSDDSRIEDINSKIIKCTIDGKEAYLCIEISDNNISYYAVFPKESKCTSRYNLQFDFGNKGSFHLNQQTINALENSLKILYDESIVINTDDIKENKSYEDSGETINEEDLEYKDADMLEEDTSKNVNEEDDDDDEFLNLNLNKLGQKGSDINTNEENNLYNIESEEDNMLFEDDKDNEPSSEENVASSLSEEDTVDNNENKNEINNDDKEDDDDKEETFYSSLMPSKEEIVNTAKETAKELAKDVVEKNLGIYNEEPQ